MTADSDPFQLQRFVEAQEGVFDRALSELRTGAKSSHWMWFIFPQIAGLGHSPISRHFAIHSVDEAKAYLDHAILGPRLGLCVEAMLAWAGIRSAEAILGPVDAMKLRSSLTLFAAAAPDDSLFEQALATFFVSPDPATLRLLA